MKALPVTLDIPILALFGALRLLPRWHLTEYIGVQETFSKSKTNVSAIVLSNQIFGNYARACSAIRRSSGSTSPSDAAALPRCPNEKYTAL